eukprot:5835756-Amphidinium_carterae.1
MHHQEKNNNFVPLCFCSNSESPTSWFRRRACHAWNPYSRQRGGRLRKQPVGNSLTWTQEKALRCCLMETSHKCPHTHIYTHTQLHASFRKKCLKVPGEEKVLTSIHAP